MVRIARGVDDATLEREPSIFTVINSSSPLRLDTPMLQGILEYSRRNQVIVMTPFTLAGAMAPVTLAGALVEQNAEALAGMVLTQVVRPGSPVVYGGFTSNVDMQSGAPAFGTPEYMRTAMVGGQLARRYNVPYRSSNVCAANAVDAQAAYESVFSLWGAIMGGVNLLMHGAGWMEGGLHAGFEKVILDAELLGMVAAFLEPPVVDEETLGLDAMREVGPGGHFFGAAHTQARYRTAFHKPMLSDWRNWESWEEAGSPEACGQGQPDLEGAPGRVSAAAMDRGRYPRGARCLRRPPGGRGRRADRLLGVLAQPRRPMDRSRGLGVQNRPMSDLVYPCYSCGALLRPSDIVGTNGKGRPPRGRVRREGRAMVGRRVVPREVLGPLRWAAVRRSRAWTAVGGPGPRLVAIHRNRSLRLPEPPVGLDRQWLVARRAVAFARDGARRPPPGRASPPAPSSVCAASGPRHRSQPIGS